MTTHKKLILIRHGQTQFNVEGKVQGWCDSPLTMEGRQQMRQAGRVLKEKGIVPEHIYSSDLKRAMDSARIIAPQAQLFTVNALREYSFGAFDGKPGDTLPDWEQLPASGAETLEACQSRVASGLLAVLEREPVQAVVVSHGIVNSLVLAMAEHDQEPEYFSNGCMLVYDFDGHRLRLEDIWNNESVT